MYGCGSALRRRALGAGRGAAILLLAAEAVAQSFALDGSVVGASDTAALAAEPGAAARTALLGAIATPDKPDKPDKPDDVGWAVSADTLATVGAGTTSARGPAAGYSQAATQSSHPIAVAFRARGCIARLAEQKGHRCVPLRTWRRQLEHGSKRTMAFGSQPRSGCVNQHFLEHLAAAIAETQCVGRWVIASGGVAR